MLMHRETNNIIKIFYDISKRLADKTVQCIITATNKYDFLEKGGQNNLQWHKNTNQERRQDLRTAAICFLWTAFGLLKHIHLKICCQKTYKTLYRKNCFCLVITHNLSLQAKRNSSGGEFPCCWRWCCGAARQHTNHRETMTDPPGCLTEHQSNRALLALHSSVLSSLHSVNETLLIRSVSKNENIYCYCNLCICFVAIASRYCVCLKCGTTKRWFSFLSAAAVNSDGSVTLLQCFN